MASPSPLEVCAVVILLELASSSIQNLFPQYSFLILLGLLGPRAYVALQLLLNPGIPFLYLVLLKNGSFTNYQMNESEQRVQTLHRLPPNLKEFHQIWGMIFFLHSGKCKI